MSTYIAVGGHEALVVTVKEVLAERGIRAGDYRSQVAASTATLGLSSLSRRGFAEVLADTWGLILDAEPGEEPCSMSVELTRGDLRKPARHFRGAELVIAATDDLALDAVNTFVMTCGQSWWADDDEEAAGYEVVLFVRPTAAAAGSPFGEDKEDADGYW